MIFLEKLPNSPVKRFCKVIRGWIVCRWRHIFEF